MKQTAFSVYNASAGSGKTFTLTKEYLIKLFQSAKDDGYKNILAITFTNKAVNEMKSRILNALYGFTENPFLTHSQKLLPAIQKDNPELTADYIREKSKKIIKRLLHEYASFDVLTIDKFTHKLIRSFAQNLEFSENFEVIINQDDLIDQAIARVMAKVGEDQLLTDVVLDFAKDKNDEDKSWDISFDLKNIAKQLTKEAFKTDIDQLKNIRLEDYVLIKKDLFLKKNHIQKEVKNIAESVLEVFSELGIIKESFDRGNFFNFFMQNLNTPSPAKVGLLNKLNEGAFYKKTAKNDQKKLIDGISSNIKEGVEKINELANIYKLCQYTIKNITPISLLQNINEEMNNIQEEENSKLLSTFNHVIQSEIQNQPALFLYEKLGSKYHHYFIDEFQDTSKLQWENLKPLIDNAISGEYMPSQSGSLMIVGDPKQAIYRFRNGDAEQFIHLSDDQVNPFSNPNKKTFFLDTNWRSYKQVIDFNNDFFKFISKKFNSSLYNDLYEKNSFQESNDNAGGYVQIQFLNEDEEDGEDVIEVAENPLKNGSQYFKMVLKTIRELEELGYKHKDIAVLVNKNAQGNFIAQHLIANDIKIISPDALRLTNSSEVLCVISLLKYLMNPFNLEEKVNFMILLKSASNEQIEWNSDEQAILKSHALQDLSQYLSNKNMTLNVEQLLSQSLFDAVEIIIKKLFPQSQANGYLQYFLDLVYEKNIKEQVGLNDFLTLWDEKSSTFLVPTPSAIDAVQIMSIHKSKGLEFPVVIYPFASDSISYKTSREEFFVQNPLEDIALPVLLMKATTDLANYGDAFAEIYHQKKEQVMLDIINVQYVALTRAVEHLYIFTEAKFLKGKQELSANETGSFYAEYVLSHNKELTTFELGKRIKYSDVEEEVSKEEVLPIIAKNINNEAIKISQNEALMWDSKKQEAIAFGNILHQLMQDVFQVSDVEKSLQKNLAKGIFEPNDLALFRSKINEIVYHLELRTFFNPMLKILNENPLINHLGDVLIPDKIVFHSSNKVSILDYKTGDKSVAHLKQINHYAEALIQMGYQVLEKILIYVGETLTVERIK